MQPRVAARLIYESRPSFLMIPPRLNAPLFFKLVVITFLFCMALSSWYHSFTFWLFLIFGTSANHSFKILVIFFFGIAWLETSKSSSLACYVLSSAKSAPLYPWDFVCDILLRLFEFFGLWSFVFWILFLMSSWLVSPFVDDLSTLLCCNTGHVFNCCI